MLILLSSVVINYFNSYFHYEFHYYFQFKSHNLLNETLLINI